MKHHLVVVFSVLTCIVYGQLTGNWNQNLFGYIRPNFALASDSAQGSLVNFHQPATQVAIDEQPQTRNLLLAARMALLEIAFKNLVREMRTKFSDADEQIVDLTNTFEDFQATTLARLANLELKVDGGLTCTCAADETSEIGKIPTSCADLKQTGYTKSGLFSVMGSKQVETVYCDFTKETGDSALQKQIGYQDVKSNPIYFYVQRTQKTTIKDSPIPFEIEVVNSGNAMDITSGKFTAPVTGTYFFSFNGLAQIPPTSAINSYVAALIYRNNEVMSRSQVNEINAVVNMDFLSPVTNQVTLTLQQGDTVWMQIDFRNGGYLYDDTAARCTHLNGWLLEEEIAVSLL